MADIIALIVAAGRGARAGLDRPKQYAVLAGRPVLTWTMEVFLRHDGVDAVCAVIHPDDVTAYQNALNALPGHLRDHVVHHAMGGAERQDSVRSGLEHLESQSPQTVLIHDAARPFVTSDVIDRVLAALQTSPGAIAALPVTDTLKRGQDNAPRPTIAATLPRDQLWRAQTPQGFAFAPILSAHRSAAGQALTDDAAVAETAGLPVALAIGSPDNMKLTVAEDFGLAATLIARRSEPSDDNEEPVMEYRTGQGFDVHAFTPGDHVMLCGVRIEHTHALAGHSDADVGLHAVTDALLGALSEGDIGAHFPPDDPRWAGAASHLFLEHARDLVAARRGRIIHADLTLICERPKVGPHREAMRTRLAEILSIDPDRVSVKATTTEQLGFTGRREGVAALAAATIALPATTA